ncbi:MAG: hypothetical protein ABI836_05310 [Gemmatimonadota bacterium]
MSRRTILGTSLLLLAVACQKGDRDRAGVMTGAGADVDQAVEVARGLKANQAAAESVLAAHGLTPEGFDSLMYEIAADSAKAAAYRSAIE